MSESDQRQDPSDLDADADAPFTEAELLAAKLANACADGKKAAGAFAVAVRDYMTAQRQRSDAESVKVSARIAAAQQHLRREAAGGR
jgi:hypothetical protein